MANTSGAKEEPKETDPLLDSYREPSEHSESSQNSAQPEPRSWLNHSLTGFFKMPGKEVDELEGACDTDEHDEMTYQPASLLKWSALLAPEGSIWRSQLLWYTMLKLVLIAVSVSAIVVFIIPDPVSLRISHFLKISYFLNFFVGLVLSFFVSTSVTRWHGCTEGFLELGDAIRNLQMQFQALGAPEERMDLCTRYGLLSGFFLKHQLEQEVMAADAVQEARQKMWEAIVLPKGQAAVGYHPVLDQAELAVLKEVSDPAGVMWTWISSLVARMAEDGDIPGMATPTYGRIMNLAQDAHDGIRHVRSSISVRAPFVYVHMLASLVHINNVLNAVSLGLVVGVAISVQMIHNKVHPIHDPKVRGNQAERDISFGLITIVICSLGPLFYQAITEISIALSQPFASQFGRIPVDRCLGNLEEDLADGKLMASQLPHWHHPHFKQPAK